MLAELAYFTVLAEQANFTVLAEQANFTVLAEQANFTVLAEQANFTVLAELANKPSSMSQHSNQVRDHTPHGSRNTHTPALLGIIQTQTHSPPGQFLVLTL